VCACVCVCACARVLQKQHNFSFNLFFGTKEDTIVKANLLPFSNERRAINICPSKYNEAEHRTVRYAKVHGKWNLFVLSGHTIY
jgi:hypothetical protein